MGLVIWSLTHHHHIAILLAYPNFIYILGYSLIAHQKTNFEMDPRYNRPSSPGGRRLNQPFRSSTGTLIYPSAYDPYYAPVRTSRESVPGPRASTERVLTSRPVTRAHKEELLPVRRAYDDYNVSPRRAILDPFTPVVRRPLTVVSGGGTASPSRYRPVVTSAGEKPASPLPRHRGYEDEQYYVQPASSSSTFKRDPHRNYSADSKDIERYLAGNRETRDRSDRSIYRGASVKNDRGVYNINVPAIRQPKDATDRDYGYEYNDRKEQMYRDTAPRSRPRRESISGSVSGSSSGRRERPLSSIGTEDYLPKSSSSREPGPPVSTRGFDKIERAGSLRQNYQAREGDALSRDYASGRSQDDSNDLQRRRSTKAPVALHQAPDDAYPSYRDETNEPHKKHHHKSRRDESSDRGGDDRGLGIRVGHHDDPRRDPEEKSRRHRESSHRKDRDEVEEREHKSRDDHHGDKHRHGEDLALGATGLAAAGLVAEGLRQRHDRDRDGPEKESERRDRKRDTDRERDLPEKNIERRDRRRDSDFDRGANIQPPSESSDPSRDNTDEDRRERRRRRRKEKEAKEQEAYRGRLDEMPNPSEEGQNRSRSYERNARPPPEPRREEEQRRSHRHHRHYNHTNDHDSYDEDSSDASSDSPREQRQTVVRVVSPKDKEPEPRPKGILRPPREKFPEDPAPVREGVAPLKDAGKKGIPPNARWTKIDRKLVNPEALEMGNERFEERVDSVIVLRVLTKEEIEQYAKKTAEIREMRGQILFTSYCPERHVP